MELTKQYFDEQLNVLAATIDDRFERQTQILMTHAELDVRKRVKQLEDDMQKIKEALHVR
jgi:hypothetical protein